MVGGAPITYEDAMSVGADGYGPDASQSVRLAKRLMVDMGYEIDRDGAAGVIQAGISDARRGRRGRKPDEKGRREAHPSLNRTMIR